MSVRTEKVASVIKRLLARPVSDLAAEHSAGLVTVTAVRLSNDLHIAKVYVSIYGANTSRTKFLNVLEDKKSSMRHILGANLRMRFTPDIKFFIDDTLDQIEHIQKLLNSVKNESPNIESNPTP
ncbi:MAG: ribosome-binding factor [Bacteroidota bacterium]|nr:ribosome-binding factor [Bacteroidota bacterium]